MIAFFCKDTNYSEFHLAQNKVKVLVIHLFFRSSGFAERKFNALVAI